MKELEISDICDIEYFDDTNTTCRLHLNYDKLLNVLNEIRKGGAK